MTITIFYSWQSDTPAKINRNFIEEALKEAIKDIGTGLNVEDALREDTNVSNIILDKDTKDVPGQVPIAEVIFEKISKCGIFVPDFTFIGKSSVGDRFLMNPNVLIEYGWALNKPSRSRIVAVMNTAYGEPKGALPFDMAHLRFPLTYKLTENATPEERKAVLASLKNDLINAIKIILKSRILDESNVPADSKPVEVPFTSNPSTFFNTDESIASDSNQQVFLPNVPRLFLRILPMQKVEKLSSSKAALDLTKSGFLQPINSYKTYESRNNHGAVVYCINFLNNTALTLTQLFLNKELWGIDAHTIDKEEQQEVIKKFGLKSGFFPSIALENVFLKALEQYIKFAKETLKLSLPLKIIAGATDVRDYKMSIFDQFNNLAGCVIEDNIIWEGKIEDYNLKASQILRPFFNHVWETCGLERPDKEFLNQ